MQSSNSFGNSEDRSEREQKFSSVENKDSSSVFSSYPSSSVFQPQIGNELTPASVDAVLKEIDSLLKISREMLDRWHPSVCDQNLDLVVIYILSPFFGERFFSYFAHFGRFPPPFFHSFFLFCSLITNLSFSLLL